MVSIKVTISGDSMWPNYREGDEVICQALTKEILEVGDLVVANHPLNPEVKVFKRISEIGEDGRFILVGDNPDPTASEDSHNFGPVAREQIIGYRRQTSR